MLVVCQSKMVFCWQSCVSLFCEQLLDVQVTSRFTALVREGWLQYRAEGSSTKLLGKAWKVGWFELLADGRLTWFPSPDKRCNENRQVCQDRCDVVNSGSIAYKAQPVAH